MKNILYLIYLVLTIIFFPFIIIIDCFINIKRKDLLYFLYKRYISPFFLKKNTNNSKYIFIIATSAGEINTIINHLDKLFNNKNILIFTTSFTGYQKLKNFTNKNNLNNTIQFNYLFPENFIYTFILYLRFKPIKTIFVESEIWPSILILSKLFKGKNFLIQAKIDKKKFKNYLKMSCIINNLYSLFNIIFTINERSYRYFKLLVKETKIILSGNLKINQKFPLPETSITKLKSITFASTHKEEEEIFINSIFEILLNLNTSNSVDETSNFIKNNQLIIFFAPRHPERSKEILDKFNKIIKNKEIYKNKNFQNNIEINFLSKMKEFENFLLSLFKINNSKIQNIKNNHDTINIDKNNKKKIKIIIVDKFGILHNLYCLSYITVMGATFFEHGGGHNILEPLYYNNYVISGPFLTNLRDIFDKGIEKNICFIIDNKEINNFDQNYYIKFLSLKLRNLLRNYTAISFQKPTYINTLLDKTNPLEIIKKYI